MKRSTTGIGGVSKKFFLNNETYFLKQSIGQNGISGTIKSRNHSLTQGFLQPTLRYMAHANTNKYELIVKSTSIPNVYAINIEDEFEGPLNINIYDILGRNINGFSVDNSNEFTVDLSKFHTGYYILGIHSKNKRTAIKLLKNE